MRGLRGIAAFLLWASVVGLPTAWACPPFLRSLPSALASRYGTSLCEVYDRYAALKKRYAAQGMDATQVRAVRGPRFIDYETFFGEEGEQKDFDPWRIYDPAPETWYHWEAAEVRVRQLADANLERASTGGRIVPIYEEFLKRVHGASVQGLPRGEIDFRRGSVLGPNMSRQWAIPIDAEQHICYGEGTQPIMEWTFHKCFEDLGRIDQDRLRQKRYYDIPENPKWRFEKVIQGKKALFRCGISRYPPPQDVPKLYSDWQRSINRQIEGWYEGKTIVDPVLVAANAQRWFVSIHPFADGNGRTSRFMMDYLLTSLGLPPPVLKNMNADTMLEEEGWALEVMRGMMTTLDHLEWCLVQLKKDPKTAVCQQTSPGEKKR